MARKFSRSRRREPSTERALFKEQQFGRSSRHIDRTDLMDAIRGGEDSYLEFKVRFSNPEKLAAGICALANSGGGTIVFGVTDQLRLEGVAHPEIVEQDLVAICREQLLPPVWARIDKVSFDSGMRLVVLEVDPRRAPHRTLDGRYYVRIGSTKREATGEEVAELYRGRTGARGFEDTPLAAADADRDVDEGGLWGYVSELRGRAGEWAQHSGYPTAALLGDMRLAVRYGDALVPTVAGVLLFGLNAPAAQLLPHSRIVARRVSGTQAADPVVEEIEFAGALAGLHDRAAAFVARYADLWDARPQKRGAGAPVAARPNLPRGPVLEALANALVHRDYAQLAPTRLTLYDDRLEVTNPAPDAGLTRRALELGVREATNPRLKGIFLSAAYGAQTTNGGVPALLGVAREFTRREAPRVTITADTFRVEIPAV
jgi:ATP-dependent DNA helicase RecG